MNSFPKTLLALVALSFAELSVQAQPAAAASAATPRIDKRLANQERRIDQGVASGQLTAKETQRLEREQAAINRVENKAEADGVVTAGERKRLTHMQNKASQDIHHQKHDKQRAPAASK